MRFVPTNAQHVGRRESQQDSFGFSTLDPSFTEHAGFVAIIADGMGGMEHGDAASRLAVKAFLDAYAAKPPHEQVADALERSARTANHAVYQMALAAGVPGDAGATLVAVALRSDGLYWISVGDSAIYLSRGPSLTRLTTSHNYAYDLDARASRGEITLEQARSDPQREALTSYIGCEELTRIDRNRRPIPLEIGDSILLASDGLFKTLPEEQIAAAFSEGADNVAELLVQRTLQREKEHQDNVTVCAVHVEDDAVAAVAPPPPPAQAAELVEIPVSRQSPDPVEAPLPNWVPEEQSAAPPAGKWRVYATAALLALTIAGVAIWKLYFAEAGSTAEKAPAVMYPTGDVRPGSLEPGTAPPVDKGNEAAPMPDGTRQGEK